MYCEKVSTRHGTHEFYFFLDIVSEDNNIPFDILRRPDLEYIGKPTVEEPLTYGEIKSMTGREVDLDSVGYGRQINYRPPEVIRPENPFDLATASEPDGRSRDAYNHLLYWMSAVGKGTWQGFREACRSLGLSAYPNNPAARNAIRAQANWTKAR